MVYPIKVPLNAGTICDSMQYTVCSKYDYSFCLGQLNDAYFIVRHSFLSPNNFLSATQKKEW